VARVGFDLVFTDRAFLGVRDERRPGHPVLVGETDPLQSAATAMAT
jgi:hypothetical protein